MSGRGNILALAARSSGFHFIEDHWEIRRVLIEGSINKKWVLFCTILHSMTISFVPLVFPPSADTSRFKGFGREVKGAHPGNLTPDEFKEIERALYQVKKFLSASPP